MDEVRELESATVKACPVCGCKRDDACSHEGRAVAVVTTTESYAAVLRACGRYRFR